MNVQEVAKITESLVRGKYDESTRNFYYDRGSLPRLQTSLYVHGPTTTLATMISFLENILPTI